MRELKYFNCALREVENTRRRIKGMGTFSWVMLGSAAALAVTVGITLGSLERDANLQDIAPLFPAATLAFFGMLINTYCIYRCAMIKKSLDFIQHQAGMFWAYANIDEIDNLLQADPSGRTLYKSVPYIDKNIIVGVLQSSKTHSDKLRELRDIFAEERSRHEAKFKG